MRASAATTISPRLRADFPLLLVDERDALPYFYDVTALSKFVATAPDVIGFDPFVDLVDFLVERARVPVLT